jgi:7-keto-8-aminopelargonate synthetase-like enzyme
MFSKIKQPELNQGTKRCFAKGALPNDLIDFASNDYLGFLSEIIFKARSI